MSFETPALLARLWSRLVLAAVFVLCGLVSSFAAEPNLRLEAKLKDWTQLAQTWASSPEVLTAVRAQNKGLSPLLQGLSREKWAALEGSSDVLRTLRANDAAKFMRREKSIFISEAFVNDAAGNKVAMLEKTTNWNHHGAAKHDEPMAGKIYCGAIVYDESSAAKVVQIAVPVLDDGVPIGSLVLGINVYELAKQ
ncbi:hypothetical protein CMV30_15925 [Nibricoccus aquaticus]|uniref:Cache domain-containing protein n=2 Tax=Nibricoccus aquaticus TaxID=2576891 RepID=A0A290QA60_9BACT|nr:hypothetical protein CMV30_15925 [Nibricoccus aquaticus]